MKQKNAQEIDEIFNLSQSEDDHFDEEASLFHNGKLMNNLNCQIGNDFGLLFENESIEANSYSGEHGFNNSFNYGSSLDDKYKSLIDGKWLEKPSSYGVMGANFTSYIDGDDDRLF